MKLKRLPEDFQVTELSDVRAGTRGEFALYRLTKRGLGTPEAIEAILRRWNLPRRNVSYGGLKDKHAVTRQFVTIRRGPERSVTQTNMSLEYLGRVPERFTPGEIAANRFEIVLRSLGREEGECLCREFATVVRDGLPNYFDDQRFGSYIPGEGFIAEPWARGNYERALWLTFAAAHAFDRSGEKKQKEILRQSWGNWPECKARLERSHRRSIITFLADRPGDFKGAWGRVRVDLRSLYLAAWQSYLWNEILSDWLKGRACPNGYGELRLKIGAYGYCRDVAEVRRGDLKECEIPLPSSRIKETSEPIFEQVHATLGRLGLSLAEIRVKYPRDSFFSKGWRAAWIDVREGSAEMGEDELEAGKFRVNLAFVLPRGSYATILVKRLMAGSGAEEMEEGSESGETEFGEAEGDA